MRVKSLILLTVMTVMTLVCAAQAAPHSVALTWTATASAAANPGLISYNVYKMTGTCPTTTPTMSQVTFVSNTTALTYTDINVTTLTQYCYYVTAQLWVGTTALVSAFSPGAAAIVPPDPIPATPPPPSATPLMVSH